MPACEGVHCILRKLTITPAGAGEKGGVDEQTEMFNDNRGPTAFVGANFIVNDAPPPRYGGWF